MLGFVWGTLSVSLQMLDAESLGYLAAGALFTGGVDAWLGGHWDGHVLRVIRFRAHHVAFEFDESESRASWRLLDRIRLSEGGVRSVCRLGPAEHERVVSGLALAPPVERRGGRIRPCLMRPKNLGGLVRWR